MKKRIGSLLLILALCFTLLPTAAFAAEDEESTMPAYSGGFGLKGKPGAFLFVGELQLLGNTKKKRGAAGVCFNCKGNGGGELNSRRVLSRPRQKGEKGRFPRRR